MLTMDAVREHIKLDAGDQDGLLKIYVDAAISAAERYTGRRMKPGRVVDSFQNPLGRMFKLSAEPNGPVTARIHLPGHMKIEMLPKPEQRVAVLPVTLGCGVALLELDYATGPACPSDGVINSDPMIELGVLKFVAHAFMNRGDSAGDWAVDSGAAQLWRSFRTIGFGY